MAQDKVLLTELYPLVEKALSKKQNTEKLKSAVNEFLDRNNEKLTTLGPIHRVIFSEIEINNLYEAIEVDPNHIKTLIKKSPAIKSNWQIMNNPFNSAISMIIRFYKIKKNDDMVSAMLIYLTMSMYPSLHSKYFQFEPNEDVMNYTINNLSNKYKIKQMGTIYHALIDTTFVNDKTNGDDLVRGTDKDVVDYIMAVKTRLNSLLRKLANEYYDNKKKNVFLNVEKDRQDDYQHREIDSNTYAIERVTNNVVLKLIVDGPNIKLINMSARINQVSVNELRNYVNSLIISENREKIKVVVESILFLFLFDSQNTIEEINSNKFIMYCLEIYKKSNTTNENIIKIKKILDSWLEELGTYKKTQRLATINNFRKALFTFFVVSIQNANI